MTLRAISLTCLLCSALCGCDPGASDFSDTTSFRGKGSVMGTVRQNSDLIDGFNWRAGTDKTEPDNQTSVLVQVYFPRIGKTFAGAMIGVENGYPTVSGHADLPWVGSQWLLSTVDGTHVLTLRAYTQNSVTFRDRDSGEPLCHGEDTRARLLMGLNIDAHGEVSRRRAHLLVACNEGAAGKALDFADPELDDTQRTRYEAAIRMIRADYCGTGSSHTHEGTPFIPGPAKVPENLDGFEAVWDESGAACLVQVRDPATVLQCPIPACKPGQDIDGYFTSYVL